MAASEETKKDATERSGRTLLQNLGGGAVSVALLAAAGAVMDTVSAGVAVEWSTLGVAVGTTVLGALIAFVQRRLEGYRKDRPRTTA